MQCLLCLLLFGVAKYNTFVCEYFYNVDVQSSFINK